MDWRLGVKATVWSVVTAAAIIVVAELLQSL